mmetsp:Transcript_27926/g.64692  ORF Transcript_27926/g.64692 Transcript_27926/m.64692 type:complete len:219 (-) Transcript_27926:599-1255(-)
MVVNHLCLKEITFVVLPLMNQPVHQNHLQVSASACGLFRLLCHRLSSIQDCHPHNRLEPLRRYPPFRSRPPFRVVLHGVLCQLCHLCQPHRWPRLCTRQPNRPLDPRLNQHHTQPLDRHRCLLKGLLLNQVWPRQAFLLLIQQQNHHLFFLRHLLCCHQATCHHLSHLSFRHSFRQKNFPVCGQQHLRSHLHRFLHMIPRGLHRCSPVGFPHGSPLSW